MSGNYTYYFPHKSLPPGQKLCAVLVITRSGLGSVRVAGGALDTETELVPTDSGLVEEYHLIILQPGQTCTVTGSASYRLVTRNQ